MESRGRAISPLDPVAQRKGNAIRFVGAVAVFSFGTIDSEFHSFLGTYWDLAGWE